MPSRAAHALLAVTLIAVMLGSANLYLIYNLQASFQGELEAIDDNLRENSRTLSQTSRRVETLSQRLAALQEAANLANRNLQQQLGGLRAETNALSTRLTQLSEELSALSEDVEEVNRELRKANEEIATLSGRVALQEALIRSLQSRTAAPPGETTSPEAVYESARASVVVVRARGTAGSALGSGFLYASPGYIVTNYHVVRGASDIEVEFFDGTIRAAAVVGEDPYADLAVLAVAEPPSAAGSLELGDSGGLRVGQQVVAIGSPLGLTGSLTTGVVSQVGRLLGPTETIPLVVPVIQLDITIAPGNSGGPLLDLAGRVVGVTNAGTPWGIHFAIPSNIVKRVADALIERGRYEHPFVGFRGVTLTPEAIRTLNVLNVEASTRGIMVLKVVPGTPAEEAGLRAAERVVTPEGVGYRARDIIVSVDGRDVKTLEEWAVYVEENVSPGQTIRLGVLRSGEVVTVPVAVTARP